MLRKCFCGKLLGCYINSKSYNCWENGCTPTEACEKIRPISSGYCQECFDKEMKRIEERRNELASDIPDGEQSSG